MELAHESKMRRPCREVFLEKMEGLIPWESLEEWVERCYPQPGRDERCR